jgi:hypothetical protein
MTLPRCHNSIRDVNGSSWPTVDRAGTVFGSGFSGLAKAGRCVSGELGTERPIPEQRSLPGIEEKSAAEFAKPSEKRPEIEDGVEQEFLWEMHEDGQQRIPS